jgi:hypothetical protein
MRTSLAYGSELEFFDMTDNLVGLVFQVAYLVLRHSSRELQGGWFEGFFLRDLGQSEAQGRAALVILFF